MPFCTSCGNLLDLSRPRCTGCYLTIPQRARDEAAARVTPKTDTWTKKYCTPPAATSPRSRTSSTTTTTRHSTQTTPTASRTRTLSQLARALTPPDAAAVTPAQPFVDETQPIVPTHTGSSTRSSNSLQKVFGDRLQERRPESARCAECCAFFGRGHDEEATIYPIPGSDPMSTDAFLCYGCFARSYKRDDCPTCLRPVLGIRDDPYVSAGGREYHRRCFICVRCVKPAHLINIARFPSCNSCFALSPVCTKREVAPVPPKLSDSLGGSSRPNAVETLVLKYQPWDEVKGKTAVGPNVREMKERFSFVNKEVADSHQQQQRAAGSTFVRSASASPSKRQEMSAIPRQPASPMRAHHRTTQSTSSASISQATINARSEDRSSVGDQAMLPTPLSPSSSIRSGARSILSPNAAPPSPSFPAAASACSTFARGHRRADSLKYSAARLPIPGWRDAALGTPPSTAFKPASRDGTGSENARRPASTASPPAGSAGRAARDAPFGDRSPTKATPGTAGRAIPSAPMGLTAAASAHEPAGLKRKSILERAGVAAGARGLGCR